MNAGAPFPNRQSSAIILSEKAIGHRYLGKADVIGAAFEIVRRPQTGNPWAAF
jgi:hypothetical protein